MLDVEITLSDWVFDAIENNHVLTLDRSYFLLRKPLERRLYELARKHCGAQTAWKIGLDTLHEKCGSGSSSKEFRRLVTKIIEDDAQHDHMPRYAFTLDGEILTVRPKIDPKPAQLALSVSLLRISDGARERCKSLASGWDVYALEADWRGWVDEKAIPVKDADAHFTAFCKKRGSLR
jgi:hypothetical protein